MIKIKLKKWMKKVTAPVTITNVSLPFTPNCNGFLFVLLRANTQGRVYETFTNTTPNIADGYALAGSYVNVLLFVEKGKAVSSNATYNTQSVVYYFIPLVGGYCVTSVFSRLSAIASHLKGWWHHVDREEVSVQGTLISQWGWSMADAIKRMQVLQEERNHNHNLLFGIKDYNFNVPNRSNSASRIPSCNGFILLLHDSISGRPNLWCHSSVERKYHAPDIERNYNIFRVHTFISDSRIGSSISERGCAA